MYCTFLFNNARGQLHRFLWDIFAKQVVFLTVNHRGPLPVRELHSTGEIWCGETLGDLEPVYDLLTDEITRPEAVTQTVRYRVCTAGGFSYGESPRTPPREGTSLHRRNMVWRDPGGS